MVSLGIFKKIKGHVKSYIFVSCLIMVAMLCYLDMASGEALDFSVFYILPIAIVAWYLGPLSAYLVSFISTLAWLYAEWSLGTRFPGLFLLANCFLVLMNFLFVAFLVGMVRIKIRNSIKSEIVKQKQLAAINTAQRMCGLIGEKITQHNSEVINWVNKRKAKGQMPPEAVDRPSRIIGKNLGVLTEISFMDVSEDSLMKEGYDSYLKGIEAKLEDNNP